MARHLTKYVLTFLLLACVISSGYAQKDSLFSVCHTAKEIKLLSEEEKQVFLYANLARAFPRFFLDSVLLPVLDTSRLFNSNSPYSKSLIRELKVAQSLPLLSYNESLYKAAKSHAIESGKRNKTGHFNFERRTEPLLEEFEQVGENLSYGLSSGKLIVIQLLIDEGIPDLGHRKTLLDKDFVFLGTSIEPHKGFEVNCVQIFGSSLISR